jgi:hypothetical protein
MSLMSLYVRVIYLTLLALIILSVMAFALAYSAGGSLAVKASSLSLVFLKGSSVLESLYSSLTFYSADFTSISVFLAFTSAFSTSE